MKSDWVINLPMWLSFALMTVGLILSILLARLAYGGVLFTFTALLTAGIVVFGVHHLLEVFVFQTELISVGFEAVSSAIFLAAAIYLGYRVRKIIYQ